MRRRLRYLCEWCIEGIPIVRRFASERAAQRFADKVLPIGGSAIVEPDRNEAPTARNKKGRA